MAGRRPSQVGPLCGLLSCLVVVAVLFAGSTTADVRISMCFSTNDVLEGDLTVVDEGLQRVVYLQLSGVDVRVNQYDDQRLVFYVKNETFTPSLEVQPAVLSHPCDTNVGPCLFYYNGNVFDLGSMDASSIDPGHMDSWSYYMVTTNYSSTPDKIVTGAFFSEAILLVSGNVSSVDPYTVPIPDSEEFFSTYQGRIVDVAISHWHSRVCVLTNDSVMGCWTYFGDGQPQDIWTPDSEFPDRIPNGIPVATMSLVDIYMCMSWTTAREVYRCLGAYNETVGTWYSPSNPIMEIAGAPWGRCIMHDNGNFSCSNGTGAVSGYPGSRVWGNVIDVFPQTDKVQIIRDSCKYLITVQGYPYCQMLGGPTPRKTIRWTSVSEFNLPKELYGDFKAVYEVGDYHLVSYSDGMFVVLSKGLSNALLSEPTTAIVSEPCDEWMCAVFIPSGPQIGVVTTLDENAAAALSPWTADGGSGELSSNMTYLASSRDILCAINGGPIACRGYGEEGAIDIIYDPPEGRSFVKAVISRSTSQVYALLDDGNLYTMSLYGTAAPFTSTLAALLGLTGQTVVDIAGHVDASGGGGQWCLVSSGGLIWCSLEDGNTYLEGSPERDDLWVQVSMADSYVCARGNNGEWRCWGEFSPDHPATPDYVPTELKETSVSRVVAMPSYITLIACDLYVEDAECTL